jgi:hypothetical protein
VVNKYLEKFIIESNLVHKNRYNYDNVYYISNQTKVNIICPNHGEFLQRPSNHKLGFGCPKCSGKHKPSNEEFINKAINLHGKIYDYSKVNYINSKTKICIICSIHGDFLQSPNQHLKPQGCPKCSGSIKLSINEFIDRSNHIHDNKYDYSKSIYINTDTKIEIICPIHGEFMQRPHEHLSKKGCPECGGTLKKNTEIFVKEASFIHNNKYDYSKVNYTNNRKFINIICNIHGEFKQRPNSHLNGRGCQKCSMSNGERLVINYLNNNNIEYKYQYSFSDLVYKKLLKCDFYLPKENIIIEYHGRQHYESVEYFGGDSALEIIQLRDNVKEIYAINNNINYLIIKYDQDINLELDKKIKNNNKNE